MHVAEALPSASQIDCAITLRITTQLSFAEPAPYHHIVQRAAPTSAYTVFTPPIQSMLRLTNERNIDETTGFLPELPSVQMEASAVMGSRIAVKKEKGSF